MLEDREYMRAAEYGPNRWRTATATLLIINVAVFLIQALAGRSFPGDYLGLSWVGLRHGYIWQLLTFQFLHANLLHLLLNSLGLFSFGFAVEQFLGRRRFLLLYLISGVVGGLVHVLGGLVWPSHFGVVELFGLKQYIPMVGASAGLFGLIAAFALMFPERNLTVFLFFVFPITVSAKVLLTVSAVISVLGVIIDTSNVAHGAHAGGMVGGWLMLRVFARRARYEPEDIEVLPPPQKAPPVFKSETDFVSKEVDPILEKISRHGIQSLTASERKTLDEARKKMERR
jgi:membrane associated rhomboid family serine protease